MDAVWLGIGVLLAAIAATAPMRWAVAIVFFWLPFAERAALRAAMERGAPSGARLSPA